MGEGQGTGEGSGGSNGNIGWSIFWLIMLLLLGFWIAGLCAFLYIIFNMFAACVEALNPVCEVLLKGIQVTGLCAQYMVKGTPINEAFKWPPSLSRHLNNFIHIMTYDAKHTPLSHLYWHHKSNYVNMFFHSLYKRV